MTVIWMFGGALTISLGVMIRRAIAGLRATRALRDHLSAFDHVEAAGTYRQGMPLSSWGGHRFPHAVLLLHGFSSAPLTFRTLADQLTRAGLPYYAPALTGFGLDDLHLLQAVRASDWRRDALVAYDLLAAQADRVSIVASSYGTLLAMWVAQRRPVRDLVLVGPYLHLKQTTDQRVRRALLHPVWGPVLMLIVPFVRKPRRHGRVVNVDIADPEGARRVFHYPLLPLHSIREVWRSQTPEDLRSSRHERLVIAYGEQEETVDIAALRQSLDAAGVAYLPLAFARSAHGLLNDYDREHASAAICALLCEATKG